MFLHLKIHKCKQLDLNILHRFKYNMCSFFCKWFYSVRIFCWVFRWPKQGVMVISLQLEQYEKEEENTWLGVIPMFGTEKKLAQVACLQRMVQVVSKGQSLWTEKASHCCAVWGTVPVLEKRAGMSSQTASALGTQLRSHLEGGLWYWVLWRSQLRTRQEAESVS